MLLLIKLFTSPNFRHCLTTPRCPQSPDPSPRLVGQRGRQAGVHNLMVLVHVVRDAAACAAQRERRTDDQRELANLVN